MAKAEIEEMLKEIIAEKLGISKSKIEKNVTMEDLGADSLDVVEIIMEIEEQLRITIPDEDAEKMRTFQDMIDYIKENSQN